MKVIRIGVCGLLAFSILAHGVVEPWSESALEIAAALLIVWWAALFALGKIPRVRWHPLLWPMAAFWLFALLQYWTRRTAAPFLTRTEVLKLSALALVFFLAVQAFNNVEDWRKLAWFLLTLGFAVSVFGILQHFTFNGKLYWFRELGYGGIPFGPYVNRNHFAGLIELIIPIGVSILFLRAEDRDRMPLTALFTLIPVGALFLSASRAGIAALFLETGLVVALAVLRGQGRHQLLAGSVLFLVAGGFVIWLGAGRALERFASYRKLEVSEVRRTEMLRDSWRIFVDHPVMGTGFGTLEAVFPQYETRYDGSIVNHAHNDYVEVLAETGVIGGAICSCFLALLFGMAWYRVSSARNSLALALRIGAFSACCAFLAHSLVDFNLHIPSNALLFLMQCLLATSLMSAPQSPPERSQGRASKMHMSRAAQTV